MATVSAATNHLLPVDERIGEPSAPSVFMVIGPETSSKLTLDEASAPPVSAAVAPGPGELPSGPDLLHAATSTTTTHT
jgi:hypothetical protein